MEDIYFNELMESAREAAAFAHGDTSRCRVVFRKSPVPVYKAMDVTRTRKSLNLSQKGLANVIGVSPRTVKAWEAGRNEPAGPARRLLYLLDSDPSLLNRINPV